MIRDIPPSVLFENHTQILLEQEIIYVLERYIKTKNLSDEEKQKREISPEQWKRIFALAKDPKFQQKYSDARDLEKVGAGLGFMAGTVPDAMVGVGALPLWTSSAPSSVTGAAIGQTVPRIATRNLIRKGLEAQGAEPATFKDKATDVARVTGQQMYKPISAVKNIVRDTGKGIYNLATGQKGPDKGPLKQRAVKKTKHVTGAIKDFGMASGRVGKRISHPVVSRFRRPPEDQQMI